VSFLAIVCWALNVQAEGIALSRIWQEFFTVSNEYIMNRYNETLINSVYSQLSNVFSYTSAALGGMIISRLQDRFRILVLVVLSFLPPVLVLTVQGAKGMIFLSISLFYGGWLIRRMKSGEMTLLDRGVIKKSLLYALALLPLVTISFVARGIYALEDTSKILFALQKYYISYSSIHLYAFSDWFNYYVGAPYTQFYSDSLLETTNGFYTFMAIFRLFGDDRYVPPGVFTEYYGYGNFLSGNIYTYFRGLILDFGIFGSLVFLFICGILCNISIKVILVSKYPTFSVAIFISMMGFIYTTFIISLLIWNSIFGILIFLPLILFINQLLIIRADSAVAMGR
jgi:oligosaccharide repeat unit polymerase